MSMPPRDPLADLRLSSERAVTGVILLHGPVLLLTGWLIVGKVSWLSLLLWSVVAGIAALAHWAAPGTASTRATVATMLCATPALLVMQLAGHPWQIDAHMHFFAVLAVSAALLDRQAIIAGAAIIALHHLALDLMFPAMVFPAMVFTGGGELARVAFHAVILVFEAAALIWLVDRAANSIRAGAAAAAEITVLADGRHRAERDAQLGAAAARRLAASAMALELDTALGGIAAQLTSSSVELGLSADTLGHSAERTSDQTAAAVGSSEDALSNVQKVALATGEMADTVAEIMGRASEAASTAGRVLAETRATNATIHELSEGAGRIGNVVRLIGNIASHTNLLALNATIEAARAGEHGKGFAVVALEVKTLATQTAKATEEISAQIAQMQEVTARAVHAIQGIGNSLERTSAVATTIAAAVEQQDMATREIARAAQCAADGANGTSLALAEVKAAVAETCASVATVRKVSADAARHGETLRAGVAALSARLRRQSEADAEAA